MRVFSKTTLSPPTNLALMSENVLGQYEACSSDNSLREDLNKCYCQMVDRSLI